MVRVFKVSFKILFNVILSLVILVLVVFLTLSYFNKIRIYCVQTGSMEDKIHSGDYVLVYRTDDYVVGDIVTYRVDNYFITHRIVSIENGEIITKGDANNVLDDIINSGQIEGKVIYYGGMLNFIINFKFVIAAFLLGMYLLNSYFCSCNDEGEDKDIKEANESEETVGTEVSNKNEEANKIKESDKNKEIIDSKEIDKIEENIDEEETIKEKNVDIKISDESDKTVDIGESANGSKISYSKESNKNDKVVDKKKKKNKKRKKKKK